MTFLVSDIKCTSSLIQIQNWLACKALEQCQSAVFVRHLANTTLPDTTVIAPGLDSIKAEIRLRSHILDSAQSISSRDTNAIAIELSVSKCFAVHAKLPHAKPQAAQDVNYRAGLNHQSEHGHPLIGAPL